jgi:Sortase domain
MSCVRWPVLAVVAGVLIAGAGSAGLGLTHHPGAAERPLAPAAVLPAPHGQVAAAAQPSDMRPVARPVALTIPAIGVRTRLTDLGITSRGALQVPSSASVAGWYTGSSRPGAVGPAIIAGHVDSQAGPGVFFRLPSLHPGDLVYVRRADRTLVVFRVTSVRTYLKDRFPSAAVYGPAPDAELRLITCGGVFDHDLSSYLSNVVVYAAQAR